MSFDAAPAAQDALREAEEDLGFDGTQPLRSKKPFLQKSAGSSMITFD